MATVFFGITSENNARQNIDRWIGVAGAPDVFSEKDQNLTNFAGKLLGAYDVVSLDEALRRYPGADVWVTYRKADNTAKTLLAKLPPERIHFFDADLEYRRGCKYLGNFIYYREHSFSPCGVVSETPVVRASGPIKERLAEWQEYTTQLVGDIRREKPNGCQDCQFLKYGFWQKTIGLKTISLEANQRGDKCNFNCTYCFCADAFKRLEHKTEGFTTYEILKQIAEIPQYNSEDVTVQLANGEICANENLDGILDIISNAKWKIELWSNFSIYQEKLAALMESGRITRAVTSLDAGTKETFERIKRADCFDQVVENLRNYPVGKTRLYLQYVFLEGVNDNETDVDGYYEIAKELGGVILLSSDLKAAYTEKMRDLTLRLIKRLKADGMWIDATSSYLNSADREFIIGSYENS